ncbi:hypothetical protein PR202_gb26763 [Eleusine coracana subsp. coracana]|uniref:Uncharacterized protein n=1 Tax=Eleusine coracana subsp. coracana TaxID=191504 RepID=A0AAV5FSR7_ELECO|nr:hypothetical protein PR202_gb26763 [Eleusine coracana subsp. coracana]
MTTALAAGNYGLTKRGLLAAPRQTRGRLVQVQPYRVLVSLPHQPRQRHALLNAYPWYPRVSHDTYFSALPCPKRRPRSAAVRPQPGRALCGLKYVKMSTAHLGKPEDSLSLTHYRSCDLAPPRLHRRNVSWKRISALAELGLADDVADLFAVASR